ncbi:MAG: hypothetical protein SGJ01_14580 [Gemmatimonadota bacterium]|nr:hypothetical protein [Gemmatimonadota bacterium]
MRRAFVVLTLLLFTLTGLSAQSAPRRWGVDLLLSRDAFTGASSDNAGSVEISPNPRVAYELGVSHAGSHWGLRLGLGVASGGLRGKNGPVRLDDNSTSVDRYRAGLLLERVIARGDRLRLAAALGPTLDRWEAAGINDRTVLGARGGLHLGIVLGRLSVEEVALVGVSSSPFTEAAVAPTGKLRALWTWSIGAGVRVGL